jgi:hypothetical protein
MLDSASDCIVTSGMVPRRNSLLVAPGTPTKRRMEVRSLPRTLLSVKETWDSIECVQTSDAASRMLGSVASSSSSRPTQYGGQYRVTLGFTGAS